MYSLYIFYDIIKHVILKKYDLRSNVLGFLLIDHPDTIIFIYPGFILDLYKHILKSSFF